MFGITLPCHIFMVGLLLVCCRSSQGLSSALHRILALGPTMPTVHVTVHPKGLRPTEAARAWHLHVEEGMSIRDVCDEVVNMLGNTPSYKAVWRAIQSVRAVRS